MTLRRVVRALKLPITVCFSVSFLLAMTIDFANATGDETVYYSTDGFDITEFDRNMYLRGAPDATNEHVGSRIRNLAALSDLFAMEVLMEDAAQFALLSQEEIDWIATHAVQLETLQRYVQYEVERRLQATDWDTEAAEFYQANPDNYHIGETVSVRALLIRTDERSEAEALRIGYELLAQAQQSGVEFEQLVRSNTEDKTAAVTGGLMESVVRGQTVEPFEMAAFALREAGEFSEPVVSRFGVHLIQLLEYQMPRKKTFEEVKQDIIDALRPIRLAQYRDNIQTEARERKPSGFIEHTEALDALMLRTSDGKLGPRLPGNL
jgi:parvulin-like peptidyl-prolyl isomerase